MIIETANAIYVIEGLKPVETIDQKVFDIAVTLVKEFPGQNTVVTKAIKAVTGLDISHASDAAIAATHFINSQNTRNVKVGDTFEFQDTPLKKGDVLLTVSGDEREYLGTSEQSGNEVRGNFLNGCTLVIETKGRSYNWALEGAKFIKLGE